MAAPTAAKSTVPVRTKNLKSALRFTAAPPALQPHLLHGACQSKTIVFSSDYKNRGGPTGGRKPPLLATLHHSSCEPVRNRLFPTGSNRNSRLPGSVRPGPSWSNDTVRGRN